jgi:hypothetical protein
MMFFFFYSVYLLLVMHCDLVFFLVLFFSCWLCITFSSCVVVLLLLIAPLLFSHCCIVIFVLALPHCFTHATRLFFSCCCILIFLCYYSIFFTPILMFFMHYLETPFAFPPSSFHVLLALPLLFFLHYDCCFFHVVMFHQCSPHITAHLVLVFNFQILTGPTLDVALFTLLLLIFLCYYCSCFLG